MTPPPTHTHSQHFSVTAESLQQPNPLVNEAGMLSAGDVLEISCWQFFNQLKRKPSLVHVKEKYYFFAKGTKSHLFCCIPLRTISCYMFVSVSPSPHRWLNCLKSSHSCIFFHLLFFKTPALEVNRRENIIFEYFHIFQCENFIILVNN